MSTLPVAFEERIKKEFKDEAAAFITALQSPSPTSIRLNPGKISSMEQSGIITRCAKLVEWCPEGHYLSERPLFTLDPLLHGGAYYVQEASSMFLKYVLEQELSSSPVRMLDLCAAPGGKSTLAAATLPQGSLLVSNEVIRTRAAILKENIIKWGQDNIVVTNNDPADFKQLAGAFDIILVDAPCSGEGMFRKDAEAIEEWSENNVRLCSERQQRILADIWDCLSPNGILIYSTCTYNRQENEKILEWLLATYEAESIEIRHTFDGITPADSQVYGYHFYPHKTIGEGFFIGAVRKTNGKEYTFKKNKKTKNSKPSPLPSELRPYIQKPDDYTAWQDENIWGIVPSGHAEFIQQLERELRIIYKCCELAEINNKKIKLLPASALWQGLNRQACSIYETDYQTALTFLKKEDIPLPSGLSGNWILISYQGIGLGWCKNLGNRLNNYYPKEWRIRMQIKDINTNNQ